MESVLKNLTRICGRAIFLVDEIKPSPSRPILGGNRSGPRRSTSSNRNYMWWLWQELNLIRVSFGRKHDPYHGQSFGFQDIELALTPTGHQSCLGRRLTASANHHNQSDLKLSSSNYNFFNLAMFIIKSVFWRACIFLGWWNQTVLKQADFGRKSILTKTICIFKQKLYQMSQARFGPDLGQFWAETLPSRWPVLFLQWYRTSFEADGTHILSWAETDSARELSLPIRLKIVF